MTAVAGCHNTQQTYTEKSLWTVAPKLHD